MRITALGFQELIDLELVAYVTAMTLDTFLREHDQFGNTEAQQLEVGLEETGRVELVIIAAVKCEPEGHGIRGHAARIALPIGMKSQDVVRLVGILVGQIMLGCGWRYVAQEPESWDLFNKKAKFIGGFMLQKATN